ncbi:3-oxoacyl-ACP reductase [Saccharopolyspora sp. K220]|uniref:3-oxoacyl-ACP reductase n=1 Tax=Saccharopolyspora soli TaxID=2926618 RepID=UPI001F57CDD7|nr:3-oxoacyl-ACP reductase [Saccharopolyspora soli]MCI2418062.1 3-oxoacyl-ACP reductase [Saccharopolyspora soli]
MVRSLDGKVAVVTGAGAGLGRAEALALARAGADVVVNDVSETASAVVAEIEELGGKAAAVVGDVSDSVTAEELVATAVQRFGGLHVVVNNAGVLRDRMLFKMSEPEWDDVIRVHLRGHFLLSRNAAAHWREQYKQTGSTCGSLINTASEAFLLGSPAQPNYAAAKAGIAALTVSTARALQRMGVRANAICPRARTAMTEDIFGPAPETGIDPLSTDHVAPLVVYLAGPAAQAINGQVFVVHSGMIALMAAPAVERRFDTECPLWTEEELADTVGAYFATRDPELSFANTELSSLP